MFSSGINTFVHIARQTVDIANQHASETAEEQHQTLTQRAQLDDSLSSTSVPELRSFNVDHTIAPIPTTEASLEYFISASSRLVHSDVQKDLDELKNRLDGLKKTKESLLARLAGAAPTDVNAISSQLAALEVEIKDVLNQIQAIESKERSEKDAASGRADSTSIIEAQLERTARAYEDLLHSIQL